MNELVNPKQISIPEFIWREEFLCGSSFGLSYCLLSRGAILCVEFYGNVFMHQRLLQMEVGQLVPFHALGFTVLSFFSIKQYSSRVE